MFENIHGGEFYNQEFDAFCSQEGIRRHKTIAYTSQQNNLVKRTNRTLVERMRAMLKTTGLPKTYWAEATKTAYYIINRSSSTAIEMKTPMEMWTSKPTNYSSLYIFRCPVCVMYNDTKRTKLDPKSRKCIFLGYADRVKGYRL